jgi:hypothetical protein
VADRRLVARALAVFALVYATSAALIMMFVHPSPESVYLSLALSASTLLASHLLDRR